MRFQYTLEHAGWATAVIESGETRLEMRISYLRDSLRDLLTAVISLLNDAPEATVRFMEEPGEHQLHFTRLGGDELQLDVTWFDDWQSWGLGSSEGQVRLSCRTTLRVVSSEVLAAARTILHTIGMAEYRARWIEHEFPLEQFEMLSSL